MASLPDEHKRTDEQDPGHAELERYKRISLVGNGTYGVVYEAEDIKSGERVALKKIKLKVETDGIPSTALRQISLLREVEHPNVLPLKDVVISNSKLYLIFEFLQMDLKMFLDKNKENPLHPELIKSFMFQLLNGIYACHKHRVLHRDLKPQNLLLNEIKPSTTSSPGKYSLKIGDFGLARAFSVPVRQYTHEVITLWYRAPEILLGAEEYSTPVDVWSAGCIFAQLFLKKPLFQGDCEIDQIYRIFRCLGTPTERIWPGVTSMKEFKPATFPKWHKMDLRKVVPGLEDPKAFDLLKCMLIYDPVMRISAKNCMLHPYFDSVR